MTRKVTVLIDDVNYEKLLYLQSKLLKESLESVSFSNVVNQQLKKSFK